MQKKAKNLKRKKNGKTEEKKKNDPKYPPPTQKKKKSSYFKEEETHKHASLNDFHVFLFLYKEVKKKVFLSSFSE